MFRPSLAFSLVLAGTAACGGGGGGSQPKQGSQYDSCEDQDEITCGSAMQCIDDPDGSGDRYCAWPCSVFSSACAKTQDERNFEADICENGRCYIPDAECVAADECEDGGLRCEGEGYCVPFAVE